MAHPPANFTLDNTTLNVPILCAAGGLALAVAAQHLASSVASTGLGPFFLTKVSLAMVVLTGLYTFFELVRQGWMAWQQPAQALGVCRSASFASFLLGLISVAVSDNSSPSRWSVILCVLGLMGFFAVIFLGPTDTVSQELAYDPGPEEQYATPNKRGSLPPVHQGELVAPSARPRPRIDPRTLPPLFETDPLYSMPCPRRARFFSVVKGNDIPVASDDACVISDDETYFALCDGASGSSLPRPWATLLGQQWLKQPFQEIDEATLSFWLQEPRESWHRWVQETWKRTIDERNLLTGDKPMSTEVFRRTLQTGASATFLGLILNRENLTWYAVAIGDTCLFLFRRDRSGGWRPRLSFPLENSARFSDRPPLLPSNGNNVAALTPYFRSIKGDCRPGDVLMMATDALAQWLLFQLEQQQTDWSILPSLNDPQRFAELVDKERQSSHMVDDDTTLVVIPI